MPLRLYNSLTKCEENFTPRQAGIVTMYTCGPTVYGRPHIGNYSSFLMADLLRRWLEVGHGYKVTHVKNITDVGHLVADADTGEDKVEKQAREEFGSVTHESVLGIARKYEAQYLEDEKALNMIEPEHRPRASEYVPQMIEMIKMLTGKGHAYETEDGVYFSVETFTDYGKLSGNTLEKLNAGARISVDEAKRHPADFALWKKCVSKNSDHVLRWPSPWGTGFPGWHIECSAMSSALLGKEIDIHTGGEDNIFPHHECEIAQSECSSGSKPFARMWLHKRRIDLAGAKMSKSLGNVLTIPDLVSKGYSALDLRYYLLSVHYRTNLKFSFDDLAHYRKSRLKILEWIQDIDVASVSAVATSHQQEPDFAIVHSIKQFKKDMDSDLNVSAALSEVFGLMNYYYSQKSSLDGVRFVTQDFQAFAQFISMVRKTFGCFEPEAVGELPVAVQQLVDERAAVRVAKNFAESDRLRDAIKALGYEVRDAAGKQTVKKL